MSLQVLSPGLLTTVQDVGRHGWRHLGVGQAGALDAFSSAVANLLVGNAPETPTLEITLAGPRLRFDRGVRIALTGADIDAHVGAVALPGWRPIALPAGSELHLGTCRRGARIYLAVAGGIVVPTVLGSASTDLRGGFGGMRGRMLAAGDLLPLAKASLADLDAPRIASWWIDPVPDLDYARSPVLRVLPGHDATTPADALCAQGWRVHPDSNRQGLRLDGEPLRPADARERISAPVLPGTVQLPPDGRPIVLMADAQTVGGYPCIGHVIAADRPRLAQLRPGETVHFLPTTVTQAHRLACEQRHRLARIAYAIEQRLRAP